MGTQRAHGTVLVTRGRHLGWWVDGRSRRGRRTMWTWWPTQGLADLVAHTFARLFRARRLA